MISKIEAKGRCKKRSEFVDNPFCLIAFILLRQKIFNSPDNTFPVYESFSSVTFSAIYTSS